MIPYGRQDITDDDIAAIKSVLNSDFLTQGPAVTNFEQSLARYCGAARGIAMNSATSALHAACLALELGPGDYMWTSPNTFVATANCGIYCGAEVDFIDIDPNTYNISVSALEAKLAKAACENRLPKIVIPVHFAGQSCEMREIHNLSMKYGFRIIEDASHAVGGSYLGEPIGNCRYSDITIFSFHPVKIITTGEGGMALTNDLILAKRMEQFRSHGIVRDPVDMVGNSDGPWFYQQIGLGYNYRMTDLQAALGCSQLTRLDNYVAKRHQIAARYDEALVNLPLILPFRGHNTHSAMHLYPIKLQNAAHRREIFEGMRIAGVGVNVHYIPVHTQPYYQLKGFLPGAFPEAEQYYASAISLPIFPTLSLEQQEKVVCILKGLLA